MRRQKVAELGWLTAVALGATISADGHCVMMENGKKPRDHLETRRNWAKLDRK